jgi:hypothetical protein
MPEPTGKMDQSIIGRLPPELRMKVYEAFLDVRLFRAYHHQVGNNLIPRFDGIAIVPQGTRIYNLSRLLAVTQVCKDMRAEAIPFFFQGKPVWLLHKDRYDFEVYTPMAIPTTEELHDWSTMIAKIPAPLRSPQMTFEYRHECMLNKDASLLGQPLHGGARYAAGIRTLIGAAAPNEVIVTINLNYFSIGTFKVDCPFFNAGVFNPQPVHVCTRDEPMTAVEFERILIKIPTSDAKKACQVVKRAFADKREKLEKHRSHRMCVVRLKLNKALERLAIVERKTQELMEHLPAWRPGHSILDQ